MPTTRPHHQDYERRPENGDWDRRSTIEALASAHPSTADRRRPPWRDHHACVTIVAEHMRDKGIFLAYDPARVMMTAHLVGAGSDRVELDVTSMIRRIEATRRSDQLPAARVVDVVLADWRRQRLTAFARPRSGTELEQEAR